MADPIPKFLGGATLSSEATIYTAPASTTTRLEHLVISNGSTAGTVTVKFRDSSASTDYELLNGVAIEANGVLELADLILETGDSIKASAATTTGAKITLFGQEFAA
jgi:hypothetical protein